MIVRRVVGVIVLNDEGWFLILKRGTDRRVDAGLWNLPSGGIEEGESPEEAGLREVLEETGIRIKSLTGNGLISKHVANGQEMEVNYLLGKTTDSEVKLNWEHSEYRWVTPEEATDFQFGIGPEEVRRVLTSFGLLKDMSIEKKAL